MVYHIWVMFEELDFTAEKGFSSKNYLILKSFSCKVVIFTLHLSASIHSGESTLDAIRHLRLYLSSNSFHFWNIPIPNVLLKVAKRAWSKYEVELKFKSDKKRREEGEEKRTSSTS